MSGSAPVNRLRARGPKSARYMTVIILCWLGHTAQAGQMVARDLYTLTPAPASSCTPYANGGVVVGYAVPYTSSAAVWSRSGATTLNPGPGWSSSNATATDSVHQVGYGSADAIGGVEHALLWSGSPNSAVDLHPTGMHSSRATAVAGPQQVGYGAVGTPVPGYNLHALLWSGTAQSAVDLNPAGYSDSMAFGTDGQQQVGRAFNGETHAMLWNGSADSAADLHPAGFQWSQALGTCGTQQVGGGAPGGFIGHALLWSGTAESVISLHPAGWLTSTALGTNGNQQVGYGMITDKTHALLWTGSAESYVDLQTLLPAGYLSSQACSIDAAGNVYGVAVDGQNAYHAVVWSPVPEPVSLALLALGGVCLVGRRRNDRF